MSCKTVLMVMIIGSSLVEAGETVVIRDKLMHNGQNRIVDLEEPSTLKKGDPVNLVFDWHGLHLSSTQERKTRQFGPLIEKRGDFVFVYPNALKGDWFKEQDPVAFNLALVERYQARYNVKDIFGTGFSLGATLGYSMMAEAPEVFSGFVGVAGLRWHMKGDEKLFPRGIPNLPKTSVAIMHVVGDQDRVFPPLGGNVMGAPIIVSSIDDHLAGWRAINGCSEDSKTVKYKDVDPKDGSTARMTTWDGGTEVSLFRHTGGHNVPKTKLEDYPIPQAAAFVRPINCDVDFPEVVMAFFVRHRNKNVLSKKGAAVP
jgi:poly(3-hydroxybutyrate) depolymerase